MAYRIELLFVGDAPDDFLARAKILANADVTAAIEGLSAALEAVGFPHKVKAQTVRGGIPRQKLAPPLTAQEAGDQAAMRVLRSGTAVNYVAARAAEAAE